MAKGATSASVGKTRKATDGAKRGRPPKVTIEQLIDGVDDYLSNTEIPIVTDYALKSGISRNRLYELAKGNEELSTAIKKITDTKEVVLERGCLEGRYNPTMAIFSLKQMGWRDKVEVEDTIKTDTGIIEIPAVKA